MNILIVDDHPLVRKGLRSVLSIDGSNAVVGEAANVAGGLALIEQSGPDLAIIDLRLGAENGLDIISMAKRKGSACRFVVLTSSAHTGDFMRAEALGVDGYVLKEALPEELLYAVKLVSNGRKYYDPVIMGMMVNDVQDDPMQVLTPRECEVLALLGEGLSNGDIARKLFVSEFTVKKHVSQILDKLSLRDRTQAALFAVERGLTLKSVGPLTKMFA